jgi:hypothetical protein
MCVLFMENKINDERRCNRCNSLQTYIKTSNMTRVCRSCGNVQEFKFKKLPKNQPNELIKKEVIK